MAGYPFLPARVQHILSSPRSGTPGAHTTRTGEKTCTATHPQPNTSHPPTGRGNRELVCSFAVAVRCCGLSAEGYWRCTSYAIGRHILSTTACWGNGQGYPIDATIKSDLKSVIFYGYRSVQWVVGLSTMVSLCANNSTFHYCSLITRKYSLVLAGSPPYSCRITLLRSIATLDTML